jgi:hypothetical protein
VVVQTIAGYRLHDQVTLSSRRLVHPLDYSFKCTISSIECPLAHLSQLIVIYALSLWHYGCSAGISSHLVEYQQPALFGRHLLSHINGGGLVRVERSHGFTDRRWLHQHVAPGTHNARHEIIALRTAAKWTVGLIAFVLPDVYYYP